MQYVERVKAGYYNEAAELADAHCHLDLFDNPAEVVGEALSHGVKTIITSGGSVKGNESTSRIAKSLGVFGVVGIDPSSAGEGEAGVERYVALIKGNQRLVGIGEVGLDSHVESRFTVEAQRALFERQLAVAGSLGIPVVVHSRGMMAEVLKVLEKERPERVMFHFFEGDLEQARRAAKLGYLISVPPRDSTRMKRIINEIDIGSMVAETDAPVAGTRPTDVKGVVETISSIKQMDFSEVAAMISENVKAFFHI